jgi:hypothetical protein
VNDALRSAEFGLLAACCRWPVSEAAVRVAATEIDWDALLKLAMRQRVSGLVHRALMAAEIVPPPAAAAELARRADTIAQRNAMQAAETVRLQGLLARAGIASLALKGAALAQLAYGTLDLNMLATSIFWCCRRKRKPRCMCLKTTATRCGCRRRV